MFITENEAKDLFCPLTFVVLGEQKFGHRMFECKGSGCIAWRWGEKKHKNADTRRGFCGFAGKILFKD
ncbi:MAG: hypothetical protein HZA04_09965 [Nitrospinae bacterium]|nr:hypothetical protein [Nitrospinota bacterium]